MLAIVVAIAWGLPPSISPTPSPTPFPISQEQQQLGGSKTDGRQDIQPQPKSSQIVDQNASGENNSAENGKESPPDWITTATIVIAIAAVLQLVVFMVQACYMYRGLGLTKQAADAATESVQILNRARVVVDSLKFFDVEDAAKATFRYGYTIINKGNTTARVFEALDCVDIFDSLPDTPTYQGTPLARQYSVGPNQTMTVTIRELKKSEIDMSKIANLHALGFIRYRDEFGREWVTRYARQYPGPGNIEAFVVPNAGYNDAT